MPTLLFLLALLAAPSAPDACKIIAIYPYGDAGPVEAVCGDARHVVLSGGDRPALGPATIAQDYSERTVQRTLTDAAGRGFPVIGVMTLGAAPAA